MAVVHRETPDFWQAYANLPSEMRRRADKQFRLLQSNPELPSLFFKKLVGRQDPELWSARVSLNYRALAIRRPYGFLWFWIGDHKSYGALIS